MVGTAPITTFFKPLSRLPKKADSKKRKQNQNHATDFDTHEPSSSKKPKGNARHLLSNRTKSLNKAGFSAESSPNNATRHTNDAPAPLKTPPHLLYATPKSLARPSGSRTNVLPKDIVDLTVETQKHDTEVDIWDSDAEIDMLEPESDTGNEVLDSSVARDSSPLASRILTSNQLPPTPSSSIRASSSTLLPSRSPSTGTCPPPRHAPNRASGPQTPQRPRRAGKISEIVPETPQTPASPSKSSSEAPGDELPDLSQVPTSQSQEVEIPLYPTLRRDRDASRDGALDLGDDEIIPSSQSQEWDRLISPRKVQAIRKMEDIADLAELIPSSQSQMETELFPHTGGGHDQADNHSTPNSGDVTLCNSSKASQDIGHPQKLQHSEYNRSVIVPIEDHDIFGLFVNGDTTFGGEGDSRSGDTTIRPNEDESGKAAELTMPLSQASSRTESDSEDEDWRRQILEESSKMPPPKVLVPPSDGFSEHPSSQSQSQTQDSQPQSWQTDVSELVYPDEILEFLDMFENKED